MDFKDYRYVIQNAIINPDGTVFREAVTLNYGAFLQVCMDFVIISGSIFLVVKFLNALKRKAEDDKVTSTPTPKDIELLSEIRDLLKHDREHSSR